MTRNKFRRAVGKSIVAIVATASMCLPLFATPAMAAPTTSKSKKVNAPTLKETHHYAGEKNWYDSDDAYKDFNLALNSPEEFDQNDKSNPMGLEQNDKWSSAQTLNELFVGAGNTGNDWESRYATHEETADAANGMNIENNFPLFGGKSLTRSENDLLTSGGCKKGRVQTASFTPVDYDGDGTDELAVNALMYDEKDDDRSRQVIDIYDYNADGSYSHKSTVSNVLGLQNNFKDTDFVQDITFEGSRGLTAMAAGDYDSDGKMELAVYEPTKQKDRRGRIYFYEINPSNGQMTGENDNVSLESISGDHRFTSDMDYDDGWYLPICSLTTTKIAGRDDLVVTVSAPNRDCGDNVNHNAVLGIVHNNNVVYRSESELVNGNERMLYPAAADSDLNGNGVDELVVGGHWNTFKKSNKDVGDMSEENNGVQVYCWNTEKNNFSSASFGKFKDYKLDGTYGAFVSQAFTGHFVKNAINEEQICVITGSNAVGQDLLDIDTGFVYRTLQSGEDKENFEPQDHKLDPNNLSGWNIQAHVTQDNYMNDVDEDDCGTYLAICPMNVDRDTYAYQYTGKDYGWSEPTLYCVFNAVPYWRELDYFNNVPGGETWSISCGTDYSNAGSVGINVGGYIAGTSTWGVGLLGNDIKAGPTASLGFDLAATGTWTRQHMTTDSLDISPLVDQNAAIVFAYPVVNYKYKVHTPETTVTQVAYDALPDEDKAKYHVGQVIPEHDEDIVYTCMLAPTFSSLPVEDYNALVDKYNKDNNQTSGGTKSTLQKVEYGTGEKQIPDRSIGDPTTYMHDTTKVNDYIKKDDKGRFSANIDTESSKTLSHNKSNGTSQNYDFSAALNGSMGLVAEGETSFIVASNTQLQAVWQGGIRGGYAHGLGNTQGVTYSATFSALPQDAKNYGYSVALAMYDLPGAEEIAEDSGDDFTPNNKPYVIDYVVTDGPAPPEVALNLRVIGTTKNSAVLKWDKPANERREASYYEIYLERNGTPIKIGQTQGDETTYVGGVETFANIDGANQKTYTVTGGTSDVKSEGKLVINGTVAFYKVPNDSKTMNAIELIGTASINNGTARMTYTPQNDDSGVYEARYIGEQIGDNYYLTSTSEAVDVLVDNHTNLTYQLDGGTLAAKPALRTLTTNTKRLYDNKEKLEDIKAWFNLPKNLQKNQTAEKAATAKIKNTLAKKGFTFDCWYLDDENRPISEIDPHDQGAGHPDGIGLAQNNRQIIAGWSPNWYKIHYQLNGGSLANADHQNQFTIRMNKALPTPTRDGYAFDGWYLDPAFKTPVTRVAQGTDKDVTVYAKWRVATAKGVSADASGFDNKDSADNGNNGGKDNSSIVPSGTNNTNGANGINHEF